jgi:hypothetical protein
MSQLFGQHPDAQANRHPHEKRKSFWLKVKFVSGAFLGTLFAGLASNASGELWAGASHKDRQGNLVTEPDWSLALTISLIVSGVVAGLALWTCLTADKRKIP